MMIEESIVITDEKYRKGIALDEYQQEFSIVAMEEGKTGGNYMKWGYPQKPGKDRGPTEKSMPWKISLGNRHQAVARLQGMVDLLKQGLKQNRPEPETTTIRIGGGVVVHDTPNDDIPF